MILIVVFRIMLLQHLHVIEDFSTWIEMKKVYESFFSILIHVEKSSITCECWDNMIRETKLNIMTKFSKIVLRAFVHFIKIYYL